MAKSAPKKHKGPGKPAASAKKAKGKVVGKSAKPARPLAPVKSAKVASKPGRSAPAKPRAAATTSRVIAPSKKSASASSRPSGIKSASIVKATTAPKSDKSHSGRPPAATAKPAAVAKAAAPVKPAAAVPARPALGTKPAVAAQSVAAVAKPAAVMPKPVVAVAKPVVAVAKTPAVAPKPAVVAMPQKKVSSGLTARDLEHFRELLLEKRRELLGDVSSMEGEALRSGGGSNLSSLPIHMADMGTDNYEQEFTLGLVEKDRNLLREIQSALMKIKAGTFGICEATGLPISRPRLDAQPWARFSIEHARKMERKIGLL